jgi:hypothetical protein
MERHISHLPSLFFCRQIVVVAGQQEGFKIITSYCILQFLKNIFAFS